MNRLKLKKIEKDTLFYTNQKNAGVAMLMSDQTDFRAKNVIGDIEGDSIMIKGVSSPSEPNSQCLYT